MSCNTYTKKEAIFHTVYIVFLSVLAALSAYSAFYALRYITCRDDAIAACFTVFFALLILAVDFFECRAMGARLYMDADGIGVRRFGKVKVFMKWDEIKEIGIGRIPTPFGSKERAYVCDRHLDGDEKSDLIVLKYHTVHFSHIPAAWYPTMCERLPIPMPEAVKEKYVK